MKIILSIGLGRLHFLPAVEALRSVTVQNIEGDSICLNHSRGTGFLSSSDNQLILIMGWIAPFWLGRMSKRLAAREIPEAWVCRKCATAEILTQCAVRLCRLLHLSTNHVEAWGWQLFGWSSRRYLNDADIFHVRSGAGQGGAIRTARRRGMKIIVDHSIAHPRFLAEQVGKEFDMSNLFWRNVMQDCNDADLVLVNSDFVRETFVQYGFPAERLRVVYLGVEKEFRGIRSKKTDSSTALRLLFVGQFGIRKGAEYLMEAMQVLKSRCVHVKLDVVGVAPLYHRQMYEGITFHGKAEHNEVRDFLKTADVFVFPTLAEGCARAVMEAMAAGLCVVTTRESGTPIVDGETGFIVPSKDAAVLADKIEWLARNQAVVERVGAAAAKLVEQHYTWDIYASNVVEVYRDMLGHE